MVLFDPYGIYGAEGCYPKGITDRINKECARFSIAWKTISRKDLKNYFCVMTLGAT